MSWTNPRTWSDGEIVTGAIMNAHVRDNLLALTTWEAYTPSWTASSVNPSIGNGTLVGRYIEAGDLVHFYVQITFGSTTNSGTGQWSLSLPVTAVSSRLFFHNGVAQDASVTNSYYPIYGIGSSTTTIELRTDATTAGNQFRTCAPNQPFTWAQSDILFIGGTYEAA